MSGVRDTLLLWNKLGSQQQVEDSEFGSNFSIDSGTPTYVTGVFGNAIKYNGTNDAIDTTLPWNEVSAEKKWGTDSITIECWAKPTSPSSANNSLWQLGDSNAPNNTQTLMIWEMDANTLRVNYLADQPTGTPTTGRDIPYTWDTSNYHHFALSVSTTHIYLYIDGVLINTWGIDSASIGKTIPNHFTSGMWWNGSSYIYPWAGSIDNLKIWNYAKTDFSDRLIESPFYAETPRDTLLLWNRLGDQQQLEDNAFGSGGFTNNGLTYNTCKFGNGAFSDGTSGKSLTTTNVPINDTTKGTMSMWIKPNFNYNAGAYYPYLTDGPNGSRLALVLSAWTPEEWSLIMGANEWVLKGSSAGSTLHQAQSWTSGDLVFIALCWDKAGIDGTGDTTRVYIDEGSGLFLHMSDSLALPSDFSSSLTTLYMANNYSNSASARYNGGIDNFKVWNYAKTNFDDRFYESPFYKELLGYNKLVLWNKLGSTNQVQKSEIGGNLTEGTNNEYISCKFGSGLDTTDSVTTPSNSYVDGNTLDLIPNQDNFTVEYWSKIDFDIVNSVITNPPSSHNDSYRHMHCPNGSWGGVYSSIIIGMRLSTLSDGSSFNIFLNGQNSGETFPSTGTTTTRHTHINKSNGDLMHVAFSFSNVKSSTSIKCEVYVDGVKHLTYSGVTNTLTYGTATGTIRFCNESGKTDRWASIVMDNLKIHNYAKTDFSDREVEYPTTIEGTNNYVDVNKKLILWNKLGSTNEVEKSEIGLGASALAASGGQFPRYVAGKHGDAIEFYQTYDYADVPLWELDAKQHGTHSVTIEGWLNIASQPSSTHRNIIELERGSHTTLVGRFYQRADVLRFSVTGASTYIDSTWDPSTHLGEWHHFALVYGSTNFYLYIDGVQEGSQALGGADGTNMFDHLLLGIEWNKTSFTQYKWYGKMDNIKVWNYAKHDFSDRLVEYPSTVNGTNIYTAPNEMLTLWNKFGSTTEVENSEIGQNGVEKTTPVYTNGKFGGGLHIQSGATITTNTVWLPKESIKDIYSFTLEYWFKHDTAFETSKTPTFWSAQTDTSNTLGRGQHWQRTGAAGNYNLVVQLGTGLGQYVIYNWNMTDITGVETFWELAGYGDGGFHHYAYVFNRDASAGNRAKIFKDGVNIGAPTTIDYDNPNPSVIPSNYDISFGSSAFSSQPAMGIFSNVKIWGYPKEDFSDRFVEEPLDIKRKVSL